MNVGCTCMQYNIRLTTYHSLFTRPPVYCDMTKMGYHWLISCQCPTNIEQGAWASRHGAPATSVNLRTQRSKRQPWTLDNLTSSTRQRTQPPHSTTRREYRKISQSATSIATHHPPGATQNTPTMSAPSRRDYQNVPAVDLEDDDLIDPDDGTSPPLPSTLPIPPQPPN